MNVAIVIGHHPQAPGAALELGAHTLHEYDLWAPFGRELARTLPSTVDVALIERPNPDPDAELAERVNATDADCAVELHFNASAQRAEGTEMIHWAGSAEAKRLASRLQRHTLQALDLNDRGVRGRRDLAFLKLTQMPSVIAEPAFGSDEGDAWTLLTRLPDLMQAYRDAITDHLNASL